MNKQKLKEEKNTKRITRRKKNTKNKKTIIKDKTKKLGRIWSHINLTPK
jgi:hypothetical protein